MKGAFGLVKEARVCTGLLIEGTGRLSRERGSEALGHETGFMPMRVRAIRFPKKLGLLTMAKVNSSDVGHDASVLRVSYRHMGTQF